MAEEDQIHEAPEVEEQEIPEAVETEQPEPQEQPRDWSDEDEQEARLFGWKAPEEWQGEKPAGYIDNPGDYLERVQRSRIFKTMQDKLSSQERAQQDAMRRLETMQTQALQRQREQYESRMSQIAQQQRHAVENADTDSWDRLEKQRQDLIKNQPQAQPQQGPDPYVAQYEASEQGAWLRNPILRQAGAQLIDANPQAKAMTPQQQVEYAEAEIRKMYPAYFPPAEEAKPQPKAPARVDSPGLAPAASRDAGQFGKLPADAKSQFKKFVAEGIFADTKKDREEYANDYFAA